MLRPLNDKRRTVRRKMTLPFYRLMRVMTCEAGESAVTIAETSGAVQISRLVAHVPAYCSNRYCHPDRLPDDGMRRTEY